MSAGRILLTILMREIHVKRHTWQFRGRCFILKLQKNSNSERKCEYNVTLGRIRESLLPWKNNKYYIFVCVWACACACVHVALLIQYAPRMRHIVT
jgi:hypothetical protein